MTSTLQQEASRKLRFSAQQTMRVAQRLYENGYITYMRTDSTSLSESAIAAARDQARELYGADAVPDAPRHYNRKVKNAQEAHEAIRPAGDRFRTLDEVRGELERDEYALYELVWKRTVASQMADARGETVSVRLGATAADGRDAEFGTAGTVITFRGFLLAYEEGRDEPAAGDDEEKRLPPLAEGDAVEARELEPDGHSTIAARALHRGDARAGARGARHRPPVDLRGDHGHDPRPRLRAQGGPGARAVVPRLRGHEPARAALRPARRLRVHGAPGGRPRPHRRPARRSGAPGCAASTSATAIPGLKALVSDLGDIDARAINTIAIGDGIELRVGRYGPYVERDGPARDGPRRHRAGRADRREGRGAPRRRASEQRELGVDPETGHTIVVKTGRYGPYVTEVLENGEKPRTGVALQVDVARDADASRTRCTLLSLPRTVGVDPADGEEIVATNGRYGPYIKKGAETRSLETEEQLLTVTLDEALALLAQPKQRGGRAAAAPPLRELGADPVSGKPIVVKNGRFGPYVTDGEMNASLRSGDTVEDADARNERPSCWRRDAKRVRRRNAANRGDRSRFSTARHGSIRHRSTGIVHTEGTHARVRSRREAAGGGCENSALPWQTEEKSHTVRRFQESVSSEGMCRGT